MLNQPRVAKVLAVLLISMTAGAILLMALGSNPPSAGAFCLSSYYRLNPVKRAVLARVPLSSERWNRIEIYHSRTKAGNIQQLTSLTGLGNPENLNCHFVICNGLGGQDGQIQTTQKWQKQWSVIPENAWQNTNKTIKICIVAEPKTTPPTDLQRKRLEALVEMLQRKFYIKPIYIYYPDDWQ